MTGTTARPPDDSRQPEILGPDGRRPGSAPRSTRPRRRASIAVATVAFVTLLAGCGGGSASSTATTTSPPGGTPTSGAPAGTTTAGTTTAGTTPAGGTATTTVPPTGGSPTTVAVPKATGSFCGFGSQLSKALGASAAIASDPTNLQQAAVAYKTYASALLAATPAAIKPDMANLLGFDTRLYALLAKAGYDYAKVSPADLASLEQSGAKEAQYAEAISSYLEKSCGVSIPSGSSATLVPTT